MAKKSKIAKTNVKKHWLQSMRTFVVSWKRR